jgi:uncharacterized protein
MIDLPKPLLVGMIHLPALPGSAQHERPLAEIVDFAKREAGVLAEAGFGAIMIENFGDAPFLADALDPATVASLAVAAFCVKQEAGLPLGVNALRNDARSAMGIAAAVRADFVRINVHIGVSATDQGWVEGRSAQTLNYRRQLGANVGIFADVHVKHAQPISQPDIGLAAEETAYRGLADALIVSGSTTGRPADLAHIKQVKAAVPDRLVLVGSGATEETIRSVLDLCDGAIVGTSIKQDGRTLAPIDPVRARAFVHAAGS